MSTPPNRLASFRSYSFYHCLAICDSSETATILSSSTDLDTWQHDPIQTANDRPNNSPNLGAYSPKLTPGGGKYCILINGSTDATFSIQTARWNTVTGGSTTVEDNGTSIVVDGTITISEPRGVTFLDQVILCCLALGIDASMATFVIKTFFVGYTSIPGQEDGVDYIVDVPPIHFLCTDVIGTFTEIGGIYEMQFQGAAHGQTRLPQYSKLSNSININAFGTTLEGTFKEFENILNTDYKRYYDCVIKQVSSVPNQETSDILDSLRPVKYIIEVGDAYKNTGYVISNQPQQYKNSPDASSGAQVSIPAHTSIDAAIHRIMQRCPKVQEDSTVGDKGIKYEHKIYTAVISTPTPGDPSRFEYTVYYKIDRFILPADISQSWLDVEQLSDPNQPNLHRNFIQFDYIYTGKNTDILNFDIQVNVGLQYLQIGSMRNTFKDQTEPAPLAKTCMSPSALDRSCTRFGETTQIPVFFGSHIQTNSFRNQQDANRSVGALYNLTTHSSLEVNSATLRITGNPNILGACNASSQASSVTEQRGIIPDTVVDWATFDDWSYHPAFVKIKIKMPTQNDDLAIFNDTETGSYTRDFWFDGYYYVMGVEHIFDDGVFTQNLDLKGIIPKGRFESISSVDADGIRSETQVNENVKNCYDNVIGCGSTTSGTTPPVAVPEIPPPPLDLTGTFPLTSPTGTEPLTFDPTTKKDAEVVNKTPTALDDVKGWKTASPEVKDGILKAAEKYNIDPVVMAKMVYVESGFRPTIKNPGQGQTATGLFQVIDDTWLGLCNQNKIPGISPNESRSSKLAKRKDPYYNSLGGAAYLIDNQQAVEKVVGSGNVTEGDIYLAHWAGTDGASRIIKADQRTNGNMSLIELYGATKAGKVTRANHLPSNITVGQVREWAENKMAKASGKGIPLARSKTVKSLSPVDRTANRGLTNANKLAAVRDCTTIEEKKSNSTDPNAAIKSTNDTPESYAANDKK